MKIVGFVLMTVGGIVIGWSYPILLMGALLAGAGWVLIYLSEENPPPSVP